MTTIYTLHRASDHSILATADTGNLQAIAATVAEAIGGKKTARAYIHNGRGIVSAGICRNGLWHDTLRDDYHQFAPKARAERAAAGYTNDEPKDKNQ
jgi:hypothetical protein